MKILRRAALGALLAATMAGHALAAAPTADQLAAFQVGVTTIADVTAALGKPMMIMTASGQTIVSYSSIHASVKAETFIPIVGLFAGGGRSNMSSATFIFGPDGKLISTITHQSNADCSTSIVGSSCK